jgi:hypothetical protein
MGGDFILPTVTSVVAEGSVKGGSTYHLDRERMRITGRCSDYLENVRQAVYLMLRTERYDFAMYSHAYGVELKSLFGKAREEVVPKLMKNIREALLTDDRIKSVDGFSFNIKGRVYRVSFTVGTEYGCLEINDEQYI